MLHVFSSSKLFTYDLKLTCLAPDIPPSIVYVNLFHIYGAGGRQQPFINLGRLPQKTFLFRPYPLTAKLKPKRSRILQFYILMHIPAEFNKYVLYFINIWLILLANNKKGPFEKK